MRTYSLSKNPINGRDLLNVHTYIGDMPFNVWRDVGRLAGKSFGNEQGHVVYEFVIPGRLEDAKKILHGAMWVERPSDYEECGYCGFDHDYEHDAAHKWHTDNPGKGYDNA